MHPYDLEELGKQEPGPDLNTVRFEYRIGDEVRVAPISAIGRVDSMAIDYKGMMYRVVYWIDGRRYSEWVYGWEIAPCPRP